MSFYKRPFLFILCLSLLTFACTLDPICEVEGAFECLKDAKHLAYRKCIKADWIDDKCSVKEICLKEGCVFLEDYCKETGNGCLDLKKVKVCAEIGPAKIEACEEGYVCDYEACAKGEACCVASKICEKTQNTCLTKDKKQICVQNKAPREQDCEDGTECDAGECVDICHNHQLDEGELAVDCGGTCAACVKCRVHADCGVDGFCDSAFGYVCSKRCRSHADCEKNDLWDGHFCRDDGRCSPKVFETVWELTDQDLTVVLPFDEKYPKAKCDFQILWGDEVGQVDITKTPRLTDCREFQMHAYAKAGRYTIRIIGNYDGWGAFDKINTTNHGYTLVPAGSKLRTVTSFGPVGLSGGAFFGASELRLMPVSDIPDASKLKSLANFFNRANSFNAFVGHWDTSRVANMNLMFCNASKFNQPVGKWDTSSATEMSGMFDGAKVFNQQLDEWSTSGVTDMAYMFSGALAFNQPLGNWKTQTVQRMNYMFSNAKTFNQDLSNWDVKTEVQLSNTFEASGMNDNHLCALKTKGGAWLTQWADLGKTAICK